VSTFFFNLALAQQVFNAPAGTTSKFYYRPLIRVLNCFFTDPTAFAAMILRQALAPLDGLEFTPACAYSPLNESDLDRKSTAWFGDRQRRGDASVGHLLSPGPANPYIECNPWQHGSPPMNRNELIMNEYNEKIPDPKELEKELGDFLAKKFGGSVKLATPIVLPQAAESDSGEPPPQKGKTIQFDLKPQDLIAYLDQYVVKQTSAKDILATKICTHFNRIKHVQSAPDDFSDMVGVIKNNVLMLGPTGVGKTYMVRLIAKKIGVPFVKGDATKFSETGYVGGDVEDLVRDLVKEADGDIELAQYGIIYIDEIDKIASSQNLIGADVSRTGVQRALLKPMEETDVDLKVPHDPVSMLQEIDRFRKTGKKESNSVNTKHILFIMSGAFSGLEKIISRRIADQRIGFGATVSKPAQMKTF
jgi:adenylate kinase family enzyme